MKTVKEISCTHCEGWFDHVVNVPTREECVELWRLIVKLNGAYYCYAMSQHTAPKSVEEELIVVIGGLHKEVADKFSKVLGFRPVFIKKEDQWLMLKEKN